MTTLIHKWLFNQFMFGERKNKKTDNEKKIVVILFLYLSQPTQNKQYKNLKVI